MTTAKSRRTLGRLFDIRNIVGALLAIYGALLTLAGFVPALLTAHDTPAAKTDEVDLYVGTAANWWVGLVLLVIAAGFFGWAALRPQRIDDVAPLKGES